MTEIIYELKQLWPNCGVLHGRPRHSESQGSVERLNRQFENLIAHWIRENPPSEEEGHGGRPRWSLGCFLVRWQILTNYSQAVHDFPYRLLYGQLPRAGISQLPLSSELLSTLTNEADLNRVLGLSGEASLAHTRTRACHPHAHTRSRLLAP